MRVGFSERPVAICLLGAVIAAGSYQAAFAKNFVFIFRNISGTALQYQLYAAARDNVWPGASQFYKLPADGKIYNAPVSCQLGEKICFGAWIESRTDFYWGVGRNKTNVCSHCCYICRGQSTEIINLNPPNLAVAPTAPIVNAASVHPSFNCADANLNDAERTVCGDAELSQADANMSGTYNQIFAEHKGTNSLRDEQKAFLKQRDACGTDVACLKKVYWDRFNELAWINGQGHEDK